MKYKLLVLVFVPIGFLLFFSIRTTLEKIGQARAMAALQEWAGTAANTGTLPHELQKERGISAGFIGSKGANFSGELPSQRIEVDKALAVYGKQLGGFDTQSFGGRLRGDLTEASRQLEELASRRQAISALGTVHLGCRHFANIRLMSCWISKMSDDV